MADSPLVKQPSKILEDMLETYRSSNIINNNSDNPNVQNGSDIYNLSLAVSNEIGIGLSNVVSYADTLMPDTATGEDLDKILANYGLVRRPAAPFYGFAEKSMRESIIVKIGSKLSDDNGNLYEVISSYSQEFIPTNPDKRYKNSFYIQSVVPGIIQTINILTWIDTPPFFPPQVKINFNLFSGANLETDDEARLRLFNTLQNPPQYNNWSDSSKLFDDFKPSVIEKAFIYPCYNGPGTQLISLIKTDDGYNSGIYSANNFLDEVYLSQVKEYAYNKYPNSTDVVIQTVDPIRFTLCVGLNLPYNKDGWVNTNPWPVQKTQVQYGGLHVIPNSVIFIIEPGSILPEKNVTIIEFLDTKLSYINKKLTTRRLLVLDYLLVSPTKLEIVFDQDIDYLDMQNFISPACNNFLNYLKTILEYGKSMGPGQITNSPGLLPRALRQPYESISYPDKVDGRLLKQLRNNYSEVMDAKFIYRTSSDSPPIPTDIGSSPKIWTIYLYYTSILPIT